MSGNKKSYNNLITDLYIKEDYLKKNPSIHKIDSPWKIKKIFPFIDKFITYFNKKEINILDIGGGARLILKDVSHYVEKKYNIMVTKYILDLSSEMLEIQKKRNPDYKKALNEDMCNTSLGSKEIDLTLMIDVLEHIPNPIIALKELKRFSNFVLFKIPLENNLFDQILDSIKKGKIRQFRMEKFGHINYYNFKTLKKQIEKYMGIILDYNFTNVFEYFFQSKHYYNKMSRKEKLIKTFFYFMSKISPKLNSFLSPDFIMILSKCY